MTVHGSRGSRFTSAAGRASRGGRRGNNPTGQQAVCSGLHGPLHPLWSRPSDHSNLQWEKPRHREVMRLSRGHPDNTKESQDENPLERAARGR